MANIASKASDIRSKTYGAEVREALASGIEAINTEVESTTERQGDLEATFENLIINAGTSNAEIVAARHDNVNNENYNTLGERLDAINGNLAESKTFQKIARNTDGYGDRGAIIGVIANKGENPEIQVSAYTSTKQVSSYENRDSVALYTSNTSRNATLTVSSGTITYGATTVQVTGTTVDMSAIKEGMIIDTLHTPNRWASIIDSVNVATQTITVKDGWYLVQSGGSETPSMPTNNIGFKVDKVDKIWGINNNVFLNTDDETPNAVAEEIGLFNNKTGASMGGIDLVNFGANNIEFGIKIRNAVGVLSKIISGFKFLDCQYAIKNLSDTLSDFILYSTKKNEVYDKDSFYIKNDGTQNKLKVEVKNINSLSDTFNISTTVAIFNIPLDSQYILPLASENIGRVYYIRNSGSKFTIKNSEGLIFNPLTGSLNTYEVKSADVLTLISDGVNYIIQSQLGVGVNKNGDTMTGALVNTSTITATGTIASSNGNISATGTNSYVKTAQSDWDKGHFQMGGYHLWIDTSGRLRIKNGAPTSAEDGLVVGSQV